MAEHEMDLVESTVKCLRSLRAEVLGKSTNERQPAFAILTERVAEMIRSHELEIMTLASSSSIKRVPSAALDLRKDWLRNDPEEEDSSAKPQNLRNQGGKCFVS
ncbi:hypothetical protein QYF36_025821 [Acer negundo]|nr:hypothetical protein QYF36_025821 [Acer negundo]